MNDYEKLVEIIRLCYQKAKDEIEVNAIENFIMNISNIEKNSQLHLIELLEYLNEKLGVIESEEN